MRTLIFLFILLGACSLYSEVVIESMDTIATPHSLNKDPFWTEIILKNTRGQPSRQALVSSPRLKRIELYDKDKNFIRESGLKAPVSFSDFPSRYAGFRIDLAPFETKKIFVKTYESTLGSVYFWLCDYDIFVGKYLTIDNMVSGMYYGLMLLAAIFAFIFFVIFRDFLFLIYAVFVLISGFGIAVEDGYLAFLFGINDNSYFTTSNVFASVPAFSIIYTMSFFKIHKWQLYLFAILGPIFSVVCAFYNSKDIFFIDEARRGYIVLALFVSAALSILQVRKNYAARFLSIGFGFYGLVIWLGIMTDYSVLTVSPLFQRVAQMGSGIEIFFLSLSMVFRFRQKYEKLELDREEEKKKNLIANTVSSTVQMIAHDLRSPLSMIKVLFKAHQGKVLDEKFRAGILENITYCENILSDLLFSGRGRVEQGESIDLKGMLDQVLDNKIDVSRIEIDLKHSLTLSGDRIRIRRLLTNLVNNAIEARGKPEDTIWVRSRDVKEGIEIVIGNNGSYVPPEHINQLFSRFFSRNKSSGTGLGLAICQDIVLSHGGEIACRSDIVKGTEFIVILPSVENHARLQVPTSI